MKELDIELSSIEATAYWWVNTIRNKVREIAIQGYTSTSELKFAKLFYDYTEVEWRNLYLALIPYIAGDVNNYISRGNTLEIDAFSQDTAKLGHARLKEELSKIMKVRVPDICLSSNNAKDSVIYTNLFGACVWYKSCGVTDLPSKYEPTYVLTGNTEKLYFYYLLLATIFVLKQKDRNFQSIPKLREKFCREYIDIYHPEETLEKLIDLFNHIFEHERERGILLWGGGFNEERYAAHFFEIDLIGFIPKTDAAEYFADVVLSKIKIDEPVSHRRTLKKDGNK